MESIKCTVHKLDDSTYYIDQYDVHLYLFLGKERAMLLDTGFAGADTFRDTIAQITDLPLVVVNSHGHPDHSGGNLMFDAVYAHPSGFDAVREYQNGTGNLLPLNEGDTIDLGGRVFEAVLIPGHQNGALALLNRAERLIACGDYVVTTPVVMYLPNADFHAYLESLKRIKSLTGEFDRIFPAHGDLSVDKDQIDRLIACTEAYLSGQLEGVPASGPDGTPCKQYILNGASIYVT